MFSKVKGNFQPPVPRVKLSDPRYQRSWGWPCGKKPAAENHRVFPVILLKERHKKNWLVVEPTHLNNMLVKMEIISPIFGVKIKKYVKPTQKKHRLQAFGQLEKMYPYGSKNSFPKNLEVFKVIFLGRIFLASYIIWQKNMRRVCGGLKNGWSIGMTPEFTLMVMVFHLQYFLEDV